MSRQASIPYVTEAEKPIKIGDHGKKGMPKAGSSMEILRQENDARQEPISARVKSPSMESYFPHLFPTPSSLAFGKEEHQ